MNYVDKTSEILRIIQTRYFQSESFIYIALDTSKARYMKIWWKDLSVFLPHTSFWGGVLPPKPPVHENILNHFFERFSTTELR